MPEFKSREEYLKWKEQKLKDVPIKSVVSDNAVGQSGAPVKPLIPIHVAELMKNIISTPIVRFAIFVCCVIAGFAIWNGLGVEGFFGGLIGIGIIVVAIYIYFLPFFIAEKRNHHNVQAIKTLNIFLGWTILGWVAALVWANTQVKD